MNYYKLLFKSSIHLGERENFLESTDIVIHSDTLFSAFCNCYLLLYGESELNNLLDRFLKGEPPFIISSAFPWWEDKFYFPVPLNQIPKEKKFKKIKFVEKDAWGKLLSGEKLENLNNFKSIPDITTDDENKKTPYKIITTPRVALSRLNNHPGENFFHFGEVFYKENSGLFFLVDFKDETIKKEFEATLRVMSDEGIGGDRTVGKGFFEIKETGTMEFNIEIETGETKLGENKRTYITLSLYYPKEDEIIKFENSFYEIIERKGYIFSPYCKSLRRKSVRMFAEGSVLFTNSEMKGTLANVTPEIFDKHTVYRYGFCFALPCKLEV